MAEPSEELLPMGEALVVVEADLIFREAKRQFEALVRIRNIQSNTASHDPAANLPYTRRRSEEIRGSKSLKGINLPQYYRNLFDEATVGLDEWDKLRLLKICMAYKTKAQILGYLELLGDGGDTFDWVLVLKDVVRNYSRDSNFGSSREVSEAVVNTPGKLHEAPIGPYFITTTLPLAYPEEFFAPFACHVPMGRLTVTSILSYPSAMLLALSDDITELQRQTLPDFWKDDLSEDEASWAALFEHLLQARESLILVNGQDLIMDDEDGYGLEDLHMWLAAWSAYRQTRGLREKGQEKLLKMKLGLRANGDTTEDEKSDGGVQLAVPENGRKKRVSWNEEALVMVREISPMRQKKRKRRQSRC